MASYSVAGHLFDGMVLRGRWICEGRGVRGSCLFVVAVVAAIYNVKQQNLDLSRIREKNCSTESRK